MSAPRRLGLFRPEMPDEEIQAILDQLQKGSPARTLEAEATPTPTGVVYLTTDGHWRRANLSGAEDQMIILQSWKAEVDIIAVYLMPVAQRVILRVRNRNENPDRPGRAIGERWEEADDATIRALGQHFNRPALLQLLPGG